jgi:hypothetical protein
MRLCLVWHDLGCCFGFCWVW